MDVSVLYLKNNISYKTVLKKYGLSSKSVGKKNQVLQKTFRRFSFLLCPKNKPVCKVISEVAEM